MRADSIRVDGKQAIRVGSVILEPKKIRDVPAEYPPIARTARIAGNVVIEAVIDAEGKVRSARVLKSIPLLDQAALDAVKQWEYEPTYLNGEAVPIVITVTVPFALK